jgi:hypothetical protein
MIVQAAARLSSMAGRSRKRRAIHSHHRQINLFGTASPISPLDTPAWQNLPEETQGALTSLMARLILDHARAGRARPETKGRS